MKKPHKHAAVIKAWADGASIQMKDPEVDDWEDIAEPHFWHDHFDYRVKPTAVRYMAVMNIAGEVFIGKAFSSRSEAFGAASTVPGDLLRVELDPNTLELVSATMGSP